MHSQGLYDLTESPSCRESSKYKPILCDKQVHKHGQVLSGKQNNLPKKQGRTFQPCNMVKMAEIGERRGSLRGNTWTVRVGRRLSMPAHWKFLWFYVWFYSNYKKKKHTSLNFLKVRNMEERNGLLNPWKADSLQWKILFSLWSWVMLRVMEEKAAPARCEWQNCQTAAWTWNSEDFCPKIA